MSEPSDATSRNRGLGLTRARAHDDTGSTLVEVLVSTVVLGISVTGMLVALMGSIRASVETDQHAREQSAVIAASEILHSRSVGYVPCTTTSAEVAGVYGNEIGALAPIDDSVVVTVTAVQSWAGTEFVSSCVAPDAMQRVLLQVTGSTDEPIAVIKLPEVTS
ncbi:MAG: type II secretion system protein [Ilumatobacteraceae bacterium]